MRSPISLDEFEQSCGPVTSAISLPPAAYTSEAFYQFEREAIFAREWCCVGRAEQIPNPGDYLTVSLAGEPVVAVRREDGGISVLSAVCQHRGALVATGSGSCGKFLRCPYHWWTYDLDGRLVAAPQMHRTDDFDRSAHHLGQFQVELWNGFIFANLDPAAEPLAPRLAVLDEYLAEYHLADLRTTEPVVTTGHPFNWKLMVENGIEPYHASYLHHGQFDDPKERNYEALDVPSGDAIVSIVNHGFVDAALNPTYRPYLPVIETLTDAQRRRFGFCTVPPNLMLGWESDFVFWFLVLPTGVSSIDIRWGYLLPESSHRLTVIDQLVDLVHTGIEGYNVQDLPMAEMMQTGLGSRFAPRGRYSHEEEVLAQFNRWLLRRYRRAEASSTVTDSATPLTVR